MAKQCIYHVRLQPIPKFVKKRKSETAPSKEPSRAHHATQSQVKHEENLDCWNPNVAVTTTSTSSWFQSLHISHTHYVCERTFVDTSCVEWKRRLSLVQNQNFSHFGKFHAILFRWQKLMLSYAFASHKHIWFALACFRPKITCVTLSFLPCRCEESDLLIMASLIRDVFPFCYVKKRRMCTRCVGLGSLLSLWYLNSVVIQRNGGLKWEKCALFLSLSVCKRKLWRK